MKRAALDIYDDMPSPMRKYISNYGWHFNKEAFEYAISLMARKDSKGNVSKIETHSKEDINSVLRKYGVTLENDTLYDGAYVFHMGEADYLGSSIPDEGHLAMYVRDTIDDIDASTETTFRRWVATMVGNGQPIPWSDLV